MVLVPDPIFQRVVNQICKDLVNCVAVGVNQAVWRLRNFDGQTFDTRNLVKRNLRIA